MLRDRADLERVASLIETNGGFRTFAEEMPREWADIAVVYKVPTTIGESRTISVTGEFFRSADGTMGISTAFGVGMQVFPQDYWTPVIRG